MKVPAVLIAWCLVVLAAPGSCWPRANGGWTDVSGLVGLGPNRGLQTLALVDWNNDRSLDMIAMTEDNTTVLVFFWQNGGYFQYPANNYSFPGPIVSAVAGDMNRDGWPDLVVVLRSGELALLDGYSSVIRTIGVVSDGAHIPLHPESPQLNVLDVVGNCGLLDLVAMASNGSFYLLRNTLRSGTYDCNFIGGNATFDTVWLSNVQQPGGRVSVGTGGVDFNGDCKSDFLFPSSYTSANGGEVTYALMDGNNINYNYFSVPSFVGFPAFADINGDGAVDILFPSCEKPLEVATIGNASIYECAHYSAIMVLFNDLGGSDVCSSSSCCAGHNSKFPSASFDPAKGSIVSSGGYISNEPFGCKAFIPRNISTLHVVATEPPLIDTPQFPAVLRPGDVDKDTKTDVIISTTWGPMVLLSQGGGDFSCQPVNGAKLDIQRTDSLYLSSIAFGFDLQEDGSIDIVGFSHQSGLGTIAYANGIDTGENYFLTALMTNGVEGGVSPSPAWGSIQIGGVHRFQWQDIDTNLKTASMTHHATSSGFALPMGRCHFGLGMTFSYIQGYVTGLRIANSKGYQLWSAYLVPNSQVVVLASPITDPSSWVLKLFLYPSKFKQLLLIALPTALALVGIPILVLKCKEVRDDRREKRDEMQ